MAEKEGDIEFELITSTKSKPMVFVSGKLFCLDKMKRLADQSLTAYWRCCDRNCHGKLKMKATEDLNPDFSDPTVSFCFIANDC